MKGTIFNVQRYSVHDGPGIRTIVFLKGCPLQCKWCSNPESQVMKPQIAYKKEKCIGSKCLRCVDACGRENIQIQEDDTVAIDFSHCQQCLSCANICPAKAIITYGEEKEVTAIIDDVEADQMFYSRSGGGMTLSGGEPLMQAEFSIALLQEAKKRRIHTAIETCGHVPWEKAKDVFALLDYVLFDIKSMDSKKHKEFTGVGNEIILDTFTKLKQTYPDKPVLVRTPVVPGFNDSVEDVLAIKDFISQFPHVEFEMLKYHRFGSQKYGYLGREYELGTAELSEQRFAELKELTQ